MFSNSLGSDTELWRLQVPSLAVQHRVLRYDHRGHGKSDPAAGDEYTIDHVAGDALALMDALGIERASVCGLSMGGAVGQWLACNHPSRVDKLVLANTGAVFLPREVWVNRRATVLAEGMHAVVDGVMQRWFSLKFAGQNPEVVDLGRAMVLACNPQGYGGCCAALRDTDFRPQLGAIRAPTLVIGGSEDFASPPERAQELASSIPGAKLVMLDSAHIGALEQGEAFTAALVDFLA
jgi:3-oxoadipate enol-lactonase